MLLILLGALYPSLVMGLAEPLGPYNLEEFSLASRVASNETITCTFDGLNYSLVPPLNNVTCEVLMRGAAAAMDISSNDRTVANILWSCLATVFACTWVSLHPNIPHPDATEWHIRRHRFSMMLCGIIAPELLVLFALREWLGARALVKIMKKKGIMNFTMVHGHFMLMGGFMLYSNRARIGVITDCDEFEHYIHNCDFTLPTEDEVCDRSKGDGLSKTLVVGQCGWFILQLLSRWIDGLAITEIELVTLAFAALNGITYFLWWKKPLNVRYGIHVVPQMQEVLPQHDGRLPGTTTSIDSNASQSSVTTMSLSMTRGPLRSITVISDGVSAHSGSTPSYEHDDLGSIAIFFRAKISGRSTLDIYSAQKQRDVQTSMFDIKINTTSMFVATLAFSVIGILFGAIHLVAWNFRFLTPYERISWRIFGIVTTAIPALLSFRGIIGCSVWWYKSKSRSSDMIIRPLAKKLSYITGPIQRGIFWFMPFLVPFYVLSRCGILIQSLVALRYLGPEEMSQVQWTDLLPHL